jgi:hypothetical protein
MKDCRQARTLLPLILVRVYQTSLSGVLDNNPFLTTETGTALDSRASQRGHATPRRIVAIQYRICKRDRASYQLFLTPSVP